MISDSRKGRLIRWSSSSRFAGILAASELFSFCFSEHIPEDSDLILAEFGERPFDMTVERIQMVYPIYISFPDSAVNDFP
jgi:hypothetical protein